MEDLFLCFIGLTILPWKYGINEQINTICVDCGVSKMLPDDIESFDENMYCNILYELETEIINSFRKNGIELYGVDDWIVIC